VREAGGKNVDISTSPCAFFTGERADVRQAQQDGGGHLVQLCLALAQGLVVVLLQELQHLLHHEVVALEGARGVILGDARELVEAGARRPDRVDVAEPRRAGEEEDRHERGEDDREPQPHERALAGACVGLAGGCGGGTA
jgi:hypothetical protein